MVFPAEFNDLTQHFNTKGAALSHVTLALVRQLVDDLTSKGSARPPPRTTPESRILNPESSFTIVCDKHGARNRYLGLLQHYFADEFIRVAIEGKRESRYHWQWDGMPVEAIFLMQGESFLPTALASMVAKYLRELAQRAVNQFWCARVPDLRPTAGYPNGSRKFKRAIAAKQRELKINDHTLWRVRSQGSLRLLD